MKNKRVLSKIDLGSFTKPDPYKKDIIYDPRGQWDHPGENTRIPGGDITMQGVDYPVWAQPSVGPGTMMQPGQDYNFPGAEYVDEYPQMKKGGSKKGKSKYTRNILATNRLLVEGDLFKKPKKNQIFDPNASFYQDGGEANDYIETDLTSEEIEAYRDGGYIVEESHNYKKGGALLTKKVTCKKCGWTWNAADGGDDMTTCHKCGGQGLVHAQGGGAPIPKGYQATLDQFINPEVIETPYNTAYNAYTGTIGQDSSDPNQTQDWWMEHEKLHHLQNSAGALHSAGPVGLRANPFVDSERSLNSNDRRKTELNSQIDQMIKADPNLQFIPKEKLAQSTYDEDMQEPGFVGAEDLMYADPSTIEGEARAYEQYIRQGGKSVFPKKKKGGAYYDDSRDAWVSADGTVGPNGPAYADGGEYMELDLTPEEIQEYAKGGYIIEDISIPSLNQMQDGNEVTPVTAPQANPYVWNAQQQIINPDNVTPLQKVAPEVPVQKITPEVIPAATPVVVSEQKSVTNDTIPVKDSVIELQKKLKAAGYNLGNYGPNKDGIDGQMGNRTKLAQDAFEAGIPPSKVKSVNPTEKVKGQTNNYRVNTKLKDGYLPYISQGEESCVKGQGCSTNVSIKMTNLLGNITDESLWANDAWFNKSDILNKGGDFVYENEEKDFSKMQKVPKDVWSKLQVGDYVQLNRADTNSSARFASQTKDGLKNEGIEHLGFIVGKDKDGTPLVWHGSETGKAYVQRIDQPLVLHDENKLSNSNNFTYQVSSIVRSPSLKNADFSGLQNSAYYTPLDPKKKLVPKKGATELQTAAIDVLNKSGNNFKNLGYSQDDANYVGRLLIGGIMSNESKGGEDWKVVPKQIAATIWKDYLGQAEFKGDEASVGYYQMKPNYNFTNNDGTLNPLGKKLEKLGVNVEEITSGNIEAQTKAGTLILLNNYENLKKDPDFNVKTGLYKGKIPASYILAKSWQAGEGWYKRDKYKKFLDNFDVDYSNGALEKAINTIDSPYASRDMTNEYAKVSQYQAQRQKEIAKENAVKVIAEQNKKEEAIRKANPNYAYERQAPAESTNVYNPYKESLKSLDLKDFIKDKGMGSTVYKYGSKPGVKYKKDANGKWYINSGKATGNKYVAIKDPSGSRTKTLEKGAKPMYAKEGGIVTSLTQDEINQYIKNGYVVEQLD